MEEAGRKRAEMLEKLADVDDGKSAVSPPASQRGASSHVFEDTLNTHLIRSHGGVLPNLIHLVNAAMAEYFLT